MSTDKSSPSGAISPNGTNKKPKIELPPMLDAIRDAHEGRIGYGIDGSNNDSKPKELFLYDGFSFSSKEGAESWDNREDKEIRHVIEYSAFAEATERYQSALEEIERLRGFFKRPKDFDAWKRAEELYNPDLYEHAERHRLIVAYVNGFKRADNYNAEKIKELESENNKLDDKCEMLQMEIRKAAITDEDTYLENRNLKSKLASLEAENKRLASIRLEKHHLVNTSGRPSNLDDCLANANESLEFLIEKAKDEE